LNPSSYRMRFGANTPYLPRQPEVLPRHHMLAAVIFSFARGDRPLCLVDPTRPIAVWPITVREIGREGRMLRDRFCRSQYTIRASDTLKAEVRENVLPRSLAGMSICNDYYGDHNHWDQGSCLIYRNGRWPLNGCGNQSLERSGRGLSPPSSYSSSRAQTRWRSCPAHR
jgi:hypothetical protein